ncbi:MAG: DUF4197 domain-containing protein, partial [Nitrospirota bacterium]|nr:DUF4197 domain-containing protein [Nitrospirota bacterium]
FQDAAAILNGPNDSATRYLEQKTSGPLAKEMYPIVDEALAEAGAVQALESVVGEYEAIPFVLRRPSLVPGKLLLSGRKTRMNSASDAGAVAIRV